MKFVRKVKEMNNLYDLAISLFGTPPNDVIRDLYYVFIIFMVIYSFKLFVMLLRAILNIHN